MQDTEASVPEVAISEGNVIARGRSLQIALVLVGFFAVWQIGVMLFRPPEYLLPAPVAILRELMSAPLWYLDNVSIGVQN